MKRQIVRLTESDLHNIIKESVIQLLSEVSEKEHNEMWDVIDDEENRKKHHNEMWKEIDNNTHKPKKKKRSVNYHNDEPQPIKEALMDDPWHEGDNQMTYDDGIYDEWSDKEYGSQELPLNKTENNKEYPF